MKRTKRAAILLIFISVVSVLLAATSVTWAWIAMNTQVASNNMKMTIEVSPNLIISDSSSAISNYSSSNWADNYVVKSWSDEATELVPVDHYDSTTYPSVTGSNAVYLVFNNNPEVVSRTTGKATGSSALTFAHVPSDGIGTYYIDKTVYIASLDKEMTQGTDYSNLTFTILESGSGTTTNRAYKSASVDVYINGVFKGTLNLDTLSSFNVSDVTTIPLNTSSSIEITFRCYFDGALLDATDNTKTYVNSAVLATNTTDITFGITITAS